MRNIINFPSATRNEDLEDSLFLSSFGTRIDYHIFKKKLLRVTDAEYHSQSDRVMPSSKQPQVLYKHLSGKRDRTSI
jgi:hypothetical protein